LILLCFTEFTPFINIINKYIVNKTVVITRPTLSTGSKSHDIITPIQKRNENAGATILHDIEKKFLSEQTIINVLPI
jgi:hypothetical protein